MGFTPQPPAAAPSPLRATCKSHATMVSTHLPAPSPLPFQLRRSYGTRGEREAWRCADEAHASPSLGSACDDELCLCACIMKAVHTCAQWAPHRAHSPHARPPAPHTTEWDASSSQRAGRTGGGCVTCVPAQGFHPFRLAGRSGGAPPTGAGWEAAAAPPPPPRPRKQRLPWQRSRRPRGRRRRRRPPAGGSSRGARPRPPWGRTRA
mmetsp:Transcript_67275/g.178949  ORF Transcript_67275/g.178949 Transcript_67275/m.178949 type:complete len:207 (-) Transcript_67275:1392-2012(-)